MATYTFRCETHGDFQHEQPMALTTPRAMCRADAGCRNSCPKVLGAAMQFFGGRKQFHDGIEGTGETGRETRDRWLAEAARDGVPMEPNGVRWV